MTMMQTMTRVMTTTTATMTVRDDDHAFDDDAMTFSIKQ